jgi:ribose transport system permease protein
METVVRFGWQIFSQRSFRQPILTLAAAAILIVFGQIFRPGFADYNQLMNILRITSFLGIIAAGQTLVILSGGEGIDLSVGSIVTLSAVITYRLLNGSDALVLPVVLLALLVGFFVGMINGLGIALLRIPPLVMTLGMTGVIAGTIQVVTGGMPAGASAPLLQRLVTLAWCFGIPGVAILWLLLGLAMSFLLNRTTYGKELYATGANVSVAALSGVRTGRVRIITYGLSGALSALGGCVLLGYTGSVFLNLGEPYTLPSVAAVVVGGTLLSGGSGHYTGTMAGAFLLTVIQSILITAGLPEFGRQIIYGLIVLILLSLYNRSDRLRG